MSDKPTPTTVTWYDCRYALYWPENPLLKIEELEVLKETPKTLMVLSRGRVRRVVKTEYMHPTKQAAIDYMVRFFDRRLERAKAHVDEARAAVIRRQEEVVQLRERIDRSEL